ncbi:tetratricopeptide repeat protein [Metabacillus iocasae]|uniref:Tetratricopeptide (TPR) repeat protein n=1 Tax=Priestia iocasae TaxID=2291674 RepID=A0ABS2QWL9_9BACI|nr:tetratricopeptide repeat protein [Metabacillus iocasae]MBM7702889.1 tetratricopeptide (TPR) repeat protein [Metabacillus iocasae]
MNIEKKVKQVEKEVIQKPRDARLRNTLALALMENNEYEKAFHQFQQAVKLERTVQSLTNLAYFIHHEGEWLDGEWHYEEEKPILLLEEVITMNPQSHFPYSLLGEIYAHQEKYEQAKRVLEQAVNLKATFENTSNLALCCEQLGMLDEAITMYNQAGSYGSDGYPRLYSRIGYGFCLLKRGKVNETRQLANELMTINTKESQGDEAQIADLYYEIGDYQSFLTIYATLDLHFYSVEHLPAYFYSLLKIGKVEEVERIAQSTITSKQNEINQTAHEKDWTEEERQECIEEMNKDIEYVQQAVSSVKAGMRPDVTYELAVERACYLFGCNVHGHPEYKEKRNG